MKYVNDITFVNVTYDEGRVRRHVSDMNDEGWELMTSYSADRYYTFIWKKEKGETNVPSGG